MDMRRNSLDGRKLAGTMKRKRGINACTQASRKRHAKPSMGKLVLVETALPIPSNTISQH